MKRILSPSLLAWARAFDAASRHASFTRAAAELNLTQGAVSQQVRRLEEALGFPLFVRGPRELLLTPEGQKIAPVLATAFGAIADALSERNAPGAPVPVTLSCSPSFALRWLNPRLGRLAATMPQVDVRIFGEFHRLDQGRMRADGIDAAIRYDDASYEGLLAETFLDEYLVPVASPTFAAGSGAFHNLSRIDGRSLLHDTRPWHGAREDDEWHRFAEVAGMTITDAGRGKRFNLSQLAIDAAIAGEGVAIGRLALVLDDLEAGRLVPVLRIAVPAAGSYRFISEPHPPPRIAAIRRWLRAEASSFIATRNTILERMMIERPG